MLIKYSLMRVLQRKAQEHLMMRVVFALTWGGPKYHYPIETHNSPINECIVSQ